MDQLEMSEKLYLHEEDEFDEEGDGGVLMDENHPMWRSERITLNSVGIDIGSSTSHLIFSRLTSPGDRVVEPFCGRQPRGHPRIADFADPYVEKPPSTPTRWDFLFLNLTAWPA
jgi:hypothetical protein